MHKWTSAVTDDLQCRFSAGETPTWQEFYFWIEQIQSGIESHEHVGAGEGDAARLHFDELAGTEPLLDQVDGLELELSRIDTALADLESDVEDLLDDMYTPGGIVPGLETDVGGLMDVVYSAEIGNLALSEAVDELEGLEEDVDGLLADMYTPGGIVPGLETDVGGLMDVVYSADIGNLALSEEVANLDQDVGGLQAAVDDLEDDVGSLEADLGELDDAVETIDADLTALYDDVSGLALDVAVLDGRVDGAEDDIAALEEDVDGLEDDTASLAADLASLEDWVETIDADLTDLNNEVSNLALDVAVLWSELDEVADTADYAVQQAWTAQDMAIYNESRLDDHDAQLWDHEDRISALEAGMH